ncbi:DUF5659 domain-containing protein [Priestia flexa]|uniref:DUF5659 domain-containing protein n=1 Tax=Priestia flexa TaxID=86664 RepID=UPI00129485D3|nr:DUF5659 domain-containing protein [Priestia flexa]
MNEFKCLFSLRIARQLIEEGFSLVDVEPARKGRGLVFLFENTSEFQQALARALKAKNA